MFQDVLGRFPSHVHRLPVEETPCPDDAFPVLRSGYADTDSFIPGSHGDGAIW